MSYFVAELAEFIEANSDLSEDDAWELANRILDAYEMRVRHPD